MSVRGLLVAAVALAVLAGLVFWSDKNQRATEEKSLNETPNKLLNIKGDDVRKLEIAHPDGSSIALEKNASGTWEMRAPATHRVDQEAANELARSFAELRQDRVVEENAPNLSEFGLNAPSTEVRVTTNKGATHKVLIGDKTPAGANYFGKLDNGSRVFTIDESTKNALDKPVADLRDKRLITLPAEKLTKVSITKGWQTFELSRPSADKQWNIVAPSAMRADNLQTEELVRKVAEARLDASVPDDEAAKQSSRFNSGGRVATVNISDPTGSQQLEVRKDPKGGFLARSSAVEGVHKVSDDLGQALTKQLAEYRNKKLFDFGFEELDRVEVRDGAQTYSFSKSGDKWTSGGKEMDSVGVQSLIDKLRDLTATGFPARAGGEPVLDITAVSNASKRTEKVQVSKAGNAYFARRENEPAIYQVANEAIEELRKTAADVKPAPPAPAPAPAKK